eukprot:4560299-Pyramimonas_sp.AAC.1
MQRVGAPLSGHRRCEAGANHAGPRGPPAVLRALAALPPSGPQGKVRASRRGRGGSGGVRRRLGIPAEGTQVAAAARLC